MIDLKRAIQILESSTGLKLSQEQKAILNYDNQTKALVNSCAGAGKTTLLELNCLSKILRGYPAYRILGITFSHKARKDMQDKYSAMSRQVSADASSEIDGRPHFTTFHALFYHLLNRSRHRHHEPRLNVLSSPFQLRDDDGRNPLFKTIRNPSPSESTVDVIKDIFELRDTMIDDQITLDGLSFTPAYRQFKPNEDGLKDICRLISDHLDPAVYSNYFPIIKCYEKYKRLRGIIDFNDMIVLLYKNLRDINLRDEVRQFMKEYRFCFIDEFQDINNIQWSIMKQILSQEAKQHLMVVGDDDQSIYSFRGSNPNIILNLPHELSHVKVFHLSTNYRTGGNILKTVIPFIERNKFRFQKKLQSSHAGIGNVFVYTGDPHRSAGDYIMLDLLNKIKSPNVSNDQLAVLCRFNLDKAFAVDWLATHHVYIHIPKSKRLQNNKTYRMFTDILMAFCNDDLPRLMKYARQIGFSFYRFHVTDVMRQYGRTESIARYDSEATQYDVANYDDMKYGRSKYARQDDEKIADAYRNINEISKHLTDTASTIDSVRDLVDGYYKFMAKKHYIDIVNYQKVVDYLTDRAKHVKSLHAFFAEERTKESKLKSVKGSNGISVITLHQSKGLQFKYVYIFNLTQKNISSKFLLEDKLFAPNISRAGFVNKLVQIPPRELNAFDDDKGDNPFTDLITNLVSAIREHIHDYPHETKTRAQAKAGQKLAMQIIADEYPDNLQAQFDDLYTQVRSDTHMVEEERRLLYVGVTRAKLGVYINKDIAPSLLLPELDVPERNRIFI